MTPKNLKLKTTKMIHSKGYEVREALSRWGRTYAWYHRQFRLGEHEVVRLHDMINGLDAK